MNLKIVLIWLISLVGIKWLLTCYVIRPILLLQRWFATYYTTRVIHFASLIQFYHLKALPNPNIITVRTLYNTWHRGAKHLDLNDCCLLALAILSLSSNNQHFWNLIDCLIFFLLSFVLPSEIMHTFKMHVRRFDWPLVNNKYNYLKMKKDREGLSSQSSGVSTKSKRKLRPRGSMPSAWFTLPTDLQAMEVRTVYLVYTTPRSFAHSCQTEW